MRGAGARKRARNLPLKGEVGREATGWGSAMADPSPTLPLEGTEAPNVSQYPAAGVAPVTPHRGHLPENILFFARALREAGLPVGPRGVLDAIETVEATGFSQRDDFRAALHAVFVTRHEQMVVFDQAFDLFWKKRGLLEKLIAAMSPAVTQDVARKPPDAGASRVADALFKSPRAAKPREELALDTRFTMSASEILQRKDFAQMSAAEIRRAEEAIARLRLPDERVRLRRWRADPHGPRVDPRATFRRSMRAGAAAIDLAYRAPAQRFAPIVALCDISGSMSEYTRVFLHFLHALTDQRRRVSTFLFGTRLTNVTRALRHKDIDEALAECSAGVKDWSGGTRIGASLHAFNRDWSRRVLGGGAIVLLFTDGLEREGLDQLAREIERLGKSCRRLVWVNPLLRYAEFEARASGIRTMLPHVDAFRPIHNLKSMAELVTALGESGSGRENDPRLWLKRAQ